MSTETTTVGTKPDAGFEIVCRVDQVPVEGGVAALIGGEAVAVLRTHDDAVYALSNYDPISQASVLARGIVGTRTVGDEQVPFVASPVYKEAFDLRTGRCLDKEDVQVATYDVRVVDGVVQVGARK